MKRPQFTLKTLLWLMVVVAAFFGGIRFERYSTEQREQTRRLAWPASEWDPAVRP